jgi:DNA repair protein RadC
MNSNLKKTPINMWAEDDRPREKLALKGKMSLSDAELIAILIGSGNNRQSAVELSQEILNEAQNNLIELSKMGISELTSFRGIGSAKAISIIAALELGKRRLSSKVLSKKKISSSKDAYNLFLSHLVDRYDEQFRVLLLDRANQIIANKSIGEGGFAGTVADPKKIFKLALQFNASSIILGHNHPSNNVRPSDADIKLTKKIKRAGEDLDIMVLDHIIVGNDVYYSFADEGIM